MKTLTEYIINEDNFLKHQEKVLDVVDEIIKDRKVNLNNKQVIKALFSFDDTVGTAPTRWEFKNNKLILYNGNKQYVWDDFEEELNEIK